MKDVKTVDNPLSSISNPLLRKQHEDVAKMRTSLLCCPDDPYSARRTMKHITVMRVYHQVSRIIQYLDTMDRLEEKLYESVNKTIDKIDTDNSCAWVTLVTMQEKLMKNMIESHKLLEPYLNMPDLFIDEVESIQTAPDGTSILSKSSRDKLRTSAQQVLAILGPVDADESIDTIVKPVVEPVDK